MHLVIVTRCIKFEVLGVVAMRNELMAIGEGELIRVYGQLSKKINFDRRVILNLHSMEYNVHLADHICTEIESGCGIRGDMIAFTGKIYKYTRADGTVDYSLNEISDLVVAHTWLYHDMIVFTTNNDVCCYNTQGQHIRRSIYYKNKFLYLKSPFDIYKDWLVLNNKQNEIIAKLDTSNVRELSRDYRIADVHGDIMWLRKENGKCIMAYKKPTECLIDATKKLKSVGGN